MREELFALFGMRFLDSCNHQHNSVNNQANLLTTAFTNRCTLAHKKTRH